MAHLLGNHPHLSTGVNNNAICCAAFSEHRSWPYLLYIKTQQNVQDCRRASLTDTLHIHHSLGFSSVNLENYEVLANADNSLIYGQHAQWM